MFPRPAGVNLRSLGSFWISPGLSFLCLGRLVFSNIAMKFDRIPDSMSCGTIWHVIWPNRLPRGLWEGGGAPVNQYFFDPHGGSWRELYMHIYSIIWVLAPAYVGKKIRWCAGDTLLKISLPTHPHLGLFVGRPPMGVFAVGLQSASQFPFVWARCVTEEKPKMSAFSAWPGGGPGGLPPGIFFRCVRRKCN